MLSIEKIIRQIKFLISGLGVKSMGQSFKYSDKSEERTIPAEQKKEEMNKEMTLYHLLYMIQLHG